MEGPPEGPLHEIEKRERAVRRKRHWVRMTAVCNNRCLFCLDSDSQSGRPIPAETIREEMEKGREEGVEHLVLSGGEPTIHPDFLNLVRAGRGMGYRHIQVITNGRMFSYPTFLKRAMERGVSEITYSIHGHTPELHDSLVRVEGAFLQSLNGIRNALRAGRVIVNVDIVLNRRNIDHLKKIVEFFHREGVSEFDLLHIVPFGRAFEEGRDLLYPPMEYQRVFLETLEFARMRGITVWTNRLPPEVLAGYEESIQDPLKLFDEVRGRETLFEDSLLRGEMPPCSGERCLYCFLKDFCPALLKYQGMFLRGGGFPVQGTLRDLHGAMRRGAILCDSIQNAPSLHIDLQGWGEGDNIFLGEILESTSSKIFLKNPPLPLLKALPPPLLERVVPSLSGRGDGVGEPLSTSLHIYLDRYTIERFALPSGGRLLVSLKSGTSIIDILKDLPPESPSLNALFKCLRKRVRETGVISCGIPECITGPDFQRALPLDPLPISSLMDNGRLHLFGFTHFFIGHLYRVKGGGCRECRGFEDCPGLHINLVKALGFSSMRPL